MTKLVAREITESFRLERVLKSSTSGIVLRAIDPATQAAVAIKLIPCGTPAHLEASQQRFLRAVGTVASLRPPAFPSLLDHGFTPDASAFMVMEFIEGTRFDALPAVPARRLLELVLGAVDGLETLAAGEVCHGNLAPDNLFAVTTDDKESVRILGFGTAAYHAGEPARGLELATALEFRAPEKLDSTMAIAEPDWRCDLYSLALTTATLLHAQPSPLDGATPNVALPAVVTAELANPEALRSILERALRRDPTQRPSSWDEFRQGLRRALSGAPADEVATTPEVIAPAQAARPPEGSAPGDSDELQLEGAPAWLAEPSPVAAARPGPRSSAPAMGETNLVLPQRVAAAAAAPASGSAQPQLPPPTPSGWLDDGSTQQINIAERLAMGDEIAPAASALDARATEPVDANTKPEFVVPIVAARNFGVPPGAPAPVEPAVAQPVLKPSVATPEVVRPAAAKALTDSAPTAPVPPALRPPTTAVPEPPPAASAEPQEPLPEVASPAVAPTAPAKPVATAKRVAARTRRFPLWAALAIVAVVAMAGAAALWLVVQRGETRVRVAPPPPRPTTRPTPTPVPAAPTQAILQMQAAEHALTANDWEAAGEALGAITSLDQAQLAPRDLERLRGLHESVDDLRRGALSRDLHTGLLSSDLKLLHHAIKALTKEDEASFARSIDLNQTLEEARRAVNLQGLMLKAQHDGNWSQVLVNATSLLTILPRCAQASELRDQAAASLEQEADALAQKGRYEQALARLDTVGQLWSDRPGLSARVERTKAAQATDAKLATLLVSVEQTERDNAPEKGLEFLRTANPGARWEERFRQASERLTAQLAALDKAPPVVELAKDAKLEYLKGKPAVLAFHITDDHAVKGARLFARVEGNDKYVELQLRQGPGGDWSAELPFAFHQNNTVELFVVASDYSDHVGQLGSAQAPLKLKRKRNWLGF